MLMEYGSFGEDVSLYLLMEFVNLTSLKVELVQ